MSAFAVGASEGFFSAVRRACATVGKALLAPFEGQNARGQFGDVARKAVGISRETTIGETAKLCGVPLRTLLAYEDHWLVRPRMDSDVRLYSGFDRVRIQMIVDAQQQGYTLAEIAQEIGLRKQGHGPAQKLEGRLEPQQIAALIEDRAQQERDTDEAVARLKEAHRRLRRAGAK